MPYTKILSRSPYILSTGELTDLSYSLLVLTLNGASSPTYTITKNAYQFKDSSNVDKGFNSFDISDLLRDYVETTYNGTLPTLLAFAQFSYNLLNFSTTAQLPAQQTGIVRVLDGYTEFQNGLNYSLPINQVMLSCSELWMPIGAETSIYFNDANNDIQEFKVSNVDTKVDVNGTDIRINRIEECKYPHNKITFINKWGVLQDLWFFKKRVDKTTTVNSNFQSSVLNLLQNTPSYSTTSHYKKTYNFVGNQSMTLSTGLVGECYNPYVQELLMSESLWLTYEQEITPIIMTSREIEKKTSLNDYLVEYSFDFEVSNQLINNIR